MQGSKLLGFWISGIPKIGVRNQNLGAGFPNGNPGIVMYMENVKLGCSQILREVLRTETQILIIISSPAKWEIQGWNLKEEYCTFLVQTFVIPFTFNYYFAIFRTFSLYFAQPEVREINSVMSLELLTNVKEEDE